MRFSSRRVVFAALALLAAPLAARAQSDETWNAIRQDIFGETAIAAQSPILTLVAPTRADDAAFVPIEVRASLPAGDPRTIRAITLVVDENPAPMAARFTLGEGRRSAELTTRLRVNAYSYVRAVAETSDGALHMTAAYVKAAGGCSAPALKDQDDAVARLGETRLKVLAAQDPAGPTTPGPKAQLMIRHPNYSGLQMNQVTRHYIPAKFVNRIQVKEGDALVFDMEGGISLSEDPVIGFDYLAKGGALSFTAQDTDGRRFSRAVEEPRKGS